jgi:hypothetical protein
VTSPTPSSRSARIAIIAAGSCLWVLLLASLLWIFWLEPKVRAFIIEEARARGVLIEFADYDLGLSSVTLHDTQVGLMGSTALDAHVDTLDLFVSGTTLERIRAEGVKATYTEPISALFTRLEQRGRGAEGPEVPVTVTKLNAVWSFSADGTDVVKMEGATLGVDEKGTLLTAAPVTVLGRPLKTFEAKYQSLEQVLEVRVGLDAAAAPLLWSANLGGDPKTLRLEFDRVDPKALGQAFGLGDVAFEHLASGSVEWSLAEGAAGRVEGNAKVVLLGYVPPHPVELSGFRFGEDTFVESGFVWDPKKKRLTLKPVKIASGAFELAGQGEVRVQKTYATLSLGLEGNLSCKAVAKSVAQVELGTVFGQLVYNAARDHVEGTVSVSVDVAADTRRLEDVSVSRVIGVGCGLRPLTLNDLRKLKLPAPELDLIREELITMAEQAKARVEQAKSKKSGTKEPPKGGGLQLPGLFDFSWSVDDDAPEDAKKKLNDSPSDEIPAPEGED